MTQEQIRKMCKTKTFDLGDAKITVRELTRNEQKALYAKLFVCGEDGQPIVYDTDGKPAEDGWYHLREGVDQRREWLLATMEPIAMVDAVLSDDCPESFKKELVDAARQLSGLTTKDAAGN